MDVIGSKESSGCARAVGRTAASQGRWTEPNRLCGVPFILDEARVFYDKTNLPDELVMSNYFSVRDGKIVSLSVIFNQPSPY